MDNNTISKTAHGSSEIAMAILEMAEEGYYPIGYKLPIITFAREGERAYLNPTLETLVEEKMLKLEKESDKIYTTLNGLIGFYKTGSACPKGKDIFMSVNPLGKIEEVVVMKDIDVEKLPLSALYVIMDILKKENVHENNAMKRLKLNTILRLRKLKWNG